MDTRLNFTDHLLAALRRKGIFTFVDREQTYAIKAIEESHISIIILSENYASSTWCLEELVKIMECRCCNGQTVLPVFYDVDPSDVRHQRWVYKEVFENFEERFKDDLAKIQRWRQSLRQAASMTGWILRDRSEADVIDSIVKRTINILSHKSLSVADDLVGIQSRLEGFDCLVGLRSDAVRVVGICGMHGIGKTALASVVYHKIFDQFEACCFLPNVSEFSRSDGLTALQEQLLRATLKWKEVEICSVYEGCDWIQGTLNDCKTLLILDNVDDLEQLEILAGKRTWFREGSLIIIITRDEHIFKRFEVDGIYEMELLNKDEALQLFCKCAFRCDSPLEGYEELTNNILEYAKGLPLAVKSLGSFLVDRSVSEWQSVLAKLQLIPKHSIMKVLRQSFDGLPHDIEEGIFLDIARFLVGEKINYLKEIPRHHQYYPMFGNKILIDKSLLTISDQKIHMNDMLGEIFRQETIEDRGRRSRLWFYDDFRHSMETNKVTANTEAVILNQEDAEAVPLNASLFSKMINLKLLIIRNVNFVSTLEYLSDELVYLSWHKYPFTHIPSNFEPYQLVELIMTDSNITQLWEGIKMLPKLRSMSFRGSKNLIKTPDFRGILNLEMLDLEECTGLLQVDPSIEILPKLAFLNLKNCASLVSIPNNLAGMSSLKTLKLDGCSTQVKLLSNQHCPFFAKMFCYLIISFLIFIKNNKLVFCSLICCIYCIFLSM